MNQTGKQAYSTQTAAFHKFITIPEKDLSRKTVFFSINSVISYTLISKLTLKNLQATQHHYSPQQIQDFLFPPSQARVSQKQWNNFSVVLLPPSAMEWLHTHQHKKVLDHRKLIWRKCLLRHHSPGAHHSVGQAFFCVPQGVEIWYGGWAQSSGPSLLWPLHCRTPTGCSPGSVFNGILPFGGDRTIRRAFNWHPTQWITGVDFVFFSCGTGVNILILAFLCKLFLLCFKYVVSHLWDGWNAAYKSIHK